jgi:hypothetical protein
VSVKVSQATHDLEGNGHHTCQGQNEEKILLGFVAVVLVIPLLPEDAACEANSLLAV